ncbi:MAG: ABC-F family ATP-binding cassette domain-containing protein [Candidatus Omnitrophica bacterium]|nr:ABC-F family ATP-binding cassette domain-containing protein [Candidatus Omnitrophota bacterium]
MISIRNISKRYGIRVLFSGVSVDVLAGEKIGLVGRNGHGKTTLFRIIAGEEEPDEGKIFRPKNYTIGYLGQHLNFTRPTVLEEGCVGLGPEEIASEWKVKKILSGLGFLEEDFDRKPSEFSGGFQMRIALTKALVAEPNMLLLDEPTNYLDIVSIRWLEKFLRSWKNELMVISHDRDLVDSVTTHIVGIHRGLVRKITGSTGKYYAQLAKDEEMYEKRRIQDEKKRKHVMKYVNRFRSKASHARGVQSAIKKVEKMENQGKLEKIRTLSFSFNHEPLPTKQIMEVSDLTFSYDGKAPYLISGLNFTVNRHDKIGIIGKNGKGKTTLLKLLAGSLKPVGGSVKTYVAALPAYYEQANTANLNDELTVEDEISLSRSSLSKSHLRKICGVMMFSGDDAEKKIKVLSGGERSRVLLGKLLVAPSNVLFLDEPTHHLDIESCQAMMNAVRNFEGAALLVAHDEHFLNEVATKLIVFKNDRVLFYPGNYQEFLERIGWEDDENMPQRAPVIDLPSEPVVQPEPAVPVAPSAEIERPAKKHGKKMTRKARAEFSAMRSKCLKPLKAKIKSLEDEIISFEDRMKEVNRELMRDSRTGGLGAIRRSELSRELGALAKNTESCYDQLDTTMKTYDAEKRRFSNE